MKKLIYVLLVHFAVYASFILAATIDNGHVLNGVEVNGRRYNGWSENGKRLNGLVQNGAVRNGTDTSDSAINSVRQALLPPPSATRCGDPAKCTDDFFQQLSGKRLGQ